MEVLFKNAIIDYRVKVFNNYNELPSNIHPENEFNGYHTRFRPIFTYSHSFNDEEKYVEHYGNPMASVGINRITFVVEFDDTKVSFKLFEYYKERTVGKKYFIKVSSLKFVTYKFATNDFYSGRIVNGFKKRKNQKYVKKNYFASLPMTNILNEFSNICKNYAHFLSLEDTNDIHIKSVESFFSKIPNLKYNGELKQGMRPDEVMFKHYLDVRNIKYPDNFLNLISKLPIPSKRILKKNDNRLVESFMYIHGLKGEKFSKVIQKSKYVNQNFFIGIQHLFGEKFLRHQDMADLVTIMEFVNETSVPLIEHELTPKEKKNMFKILIEHIKFKDSVSTFMDHIDFYNKLIVFEEIKWKSFDGSSFNKEHAEWTEKYSYYTKGNYTRIYNDNFVKELEKVIFSEYYPKILSTSIDYNKESGVQHNCVKTYVTRPGSFIISLRKGGEESNERATIEYQIKRKKGQIVFVRHQTLGRFNQPLSNEWMIPINALDNRIDFLLKNINFGLPSVKVDFVNRTIFSDTKFVEDVTWHPEGEYLTWVNPHIDSMNQGNYPPIFGNIHAVDDDNNFDGLF